MKGVTVMKAVTLSKGVTENFTVLAAILVGCAMALVVIVGAFRIAGPGPSASFGNQSPPIAAATTH